MKRRKKLAYMVIPISVLLVLLHTVPLRSASIVSSCGDGKMVVVRKSMLLQHEGINKWQDDYNISKQLLSGVPLCTTQTDKTLQIYKLYVL